MNIYEILPMSERIKGNPYVGRGIVIGKTENTNKAVIAYFIMGRSENSRNRIFTKKDGFIYTEPFDASKVQDPSLIIYAAVKDIDNKLIVTNGDQTDTIYNFIKDGNAESRGILMNRRQVLKYFEENKDFFENTIYPNIEKYRKGNMSLRITDENGNAVSDAKIRIKQNLPILE